jgi:hypothetical protein
VIRENKGEGDSSPLIELNSQFEFTSMQWIPKIIESSKIDLNSNFESEDIELIPKVVKSSKV